MSSMKYMRKQYKLHIVFIINRRDIITIYYNLILNTKKLDKPKQYIDEVEHIMSRL